MTEPTAEPAERTIAVPTYVRVGLALLALTGLTVLVSRAPLGPWHLPAALVIAAAKALLVAVWFMHLRVSHPLDRLALAGGVLWLAILLLGTMDDYLTRAWLPLPWK